MEYPDLNKRQIEVLTYIKQALRKQGYPPTVREIGCLEKQTDRQTDSQSDR